MRTLLITLLALLLTACTSGSGGPEDGFQTFTYSFENGLMDDWAIDSTDTFVGSDEIDWSVTPSTVRATSGNTSLHFVVDNLTDAAKVWIERPFDLTPNTVYNVTIAFDFASQDWGDFNLWTIMAGATDTDPEVASDLQPTFDRDTKAWDEDTGFRWLPVSRTVTVSSGNDGRIWVIAGVWGTWETERDYFIDNVRVSITPVQTPPI